MLTLWNPTKHDFTCKYDGLDCRTAKSLEYTRYDNESEWLHVRKHLIDFVVNTRGIKSTDAVAVNKIEKEVDDGC
jgi:regulator of sigma D